MHSGRPVYGCTTEFPYARIRELIDQTPVTTLESVAFGPAALDRHVGSSPGALTPELW